VAVSGETRPPGPSPVEASATTATLISFAGSRSAGSEFSCFAVASPAFAAGTSADLVTSTTTFIPAFAARSIFACVSATAPSAFSSGHAATGTSGDEQPVIWRQASGSRRCSHVRSPTTTPTRACAAAAAAAAVEATCALLTDASDLDVQRLAWADAQSGAHLRRLAGAFSSGTNSNHRYVEDAGRHHEHLLGIGVGESLTDGFRGPSRCRRSCKRRNRAHCGREENARERSPHHG
jgi:hypothetical protein